MSETRHCEDGQGAKRDRGIQSIVGLRNKTGQKKQHQEGVITPHVLWKNCKGQ